MLHPMLKDAKNTHYVQVNCLAVTPDGDYIVSGSEDKSIKVR